MISFTPRARRLLRIAAIAGGALLALAAGWLALVVASCPPVESLASYRPPQASLVFDRDGKLLARLAPEERIVVPLSAISPKLVGAVLAVEDQRFYEHHGVDWHRVLGAFWRDLKTLSPREGSSTITMQLARNVFPDRLTRARTLRRKVAEMIVARRIERAFGKQQILEMYLNQIYLGNGYYGVEAASRGYFGRSARELTAAQAALIAALPKAPANYDPRRYPAQALRRRNLVLGQMTKSKLIGPKEEAAARKTRLRLRPAEEEAGAPWFVAEVRRELRDVFGADAETQGLRVTTTLDTALQRTAEKELHRQIELAESGKLGRFDGPPCNGDPDECLEGLFVALDAHTGDVRALVGGRDYVLSEFDRVIQARRQPGSTFKAFVWAAALQAGVPVSALVDTTAVAAPGDYAPADGQGALDHTPNLREALRVSSNRAAVALGERVGLPAVEEMARSCGIEDAIPPFPSSFLGAAEVNPLQLVAAFAPFANGGERVQPRFVDEVHSATGELLFRQPVETGPALSAEVSFIMASLLADAMDHGTGTAARAVLPDGLPALGKTGTTNGGQDVWFVGATPELVAGAWLGFDKPHPLGPAATGGRLAAPLWGRIIAAAEKGKPLPAGWQPPPGVEQRVIDVRTGGLATGSCPRDQVQAEWFVQGTAPNADCSEHQGGLTGFLERTVGRWFH
ncbi:MAG TPA: transglycosylase domain-containing protein [Myxococcales bacterium]|nr:transglycosylase domain-containing protein [Myxococcales bacterium]